MSWSCLIPLLLVLSCASGCSWRDRSGVRHTLVVGLGWVSTISQPGITALDVKALGMAAGVGGATVGLAQIHSVEINPNQASNLVVSLHTRPGRLTVTNFSIAHQPSSVQKP